MALLQSRTVHDLALRELVATLRDDGQLARVVKQWRWFSNDPADGGDIPLLPAHCPMVRLMIQPGGQATREGTDGRFHVYRMPLSIQIDTAIAGVAGRRHEVSDALDLSALIYGALWPDDATARDAADARFRAAGVADVRLTQPILPVYYDDAFLGSTGFVELVQHVEL